MLTQFKTWIEINKKSLENNVKVFRNILGSRTKLMAVVKSNAYGHGLLVFSKLANELGVDGFCVDSVIEGEKLRDAGIKKPILVLGFTLPNLFQIAKDKNIIITISNLESLRVWIKSKHKPQIHLKIDTGMHRQGFYPEDLKKLINHKTHIKTFCTGVYTHFASAKDINYPTFTDKQFKEFKIACGILEKLGFRNLIKHMGATGATLINKKYHLDWVRIGIGLYGLWPSRELEMQLGNQIKLKPILSWKTIISEIKLLKEGDFVGYDLVHRVRVSAKLAVLPIGYWHGMPRSLSDIGEVLVNGKIAKILGRISMDMMVVDVTNIKCGVYDEVTLIGNATYLAEKSGTNHYEFLTRLNPLIERKVV